MIADRRVGLLQAEELEIHETVIEAGMSRMHRRYQAVKAAVPGVLHHQPAGAEKYGQKLLHVSLTIGKTGNFSETQSPLAKPIHFLAIHRFHRHSQLFAVHDQGHREDNLLSPRGDENLRTIRKMVGRNPHLVLVRFTQAGLQVRVVDQMKSRLAFFASGGNLVAEIKGGLWNCNNILSGKVNPW